MSRSDACLDTEKGTSLSSLTIIYISLLRKETRIIVMSCCYHAAYRDDSVVGVNAILGVNGLIWLSPDPNYMPVDGESDDAPPRKKVARVANCIRLLAELLLPIMPVRINEIYQVNPKSHICKLGLISQMAGSANLQVFPPAVFETFTVSKVSVVQQTCHSSWRGESANRPIYLCYTRFETY